MVEKNFWLVRNSKKYVFWDTLAKSHLKTATLRTQAHTLPKNPSEFA